MSSISFSKKMFGYDVMEVDNYINKVNKEYEKSLSDKQQEAKRLKQFGLVTEHEIKDLQKKIEKFYLQKSKVADVVIDIQKQSDIVEEQKVRVCEQQKIDLENEVSKKLQEKDKIKRDTEELKREVLNVLDRYKGNLGISI